MARRLRCISRPRAKICVRQRPTSTAPAGWRPSCTAGAAAEACRHRGTCALLRNDYAGAERHYPSRSLARQEKNASLESKAANLVAQVWNRRYDEAADWLNRALDPASRLKGISTSSGY
jgi:hypothetical protein